MTMAQIRKALVPLLAGVASLVALGIFTGPALVVATAVLGVASSLGVYKVKNAPQA